MRASSCERVASDARRASRRIDCPSTAAGAATSTTAVDWCARCARARVHLTICTLFRFLRQLRLAISKLRPLLERGDAWAAFCLVRRRSFVVRSFVVGRSFVVAPVTYRAQARLHAVGKRPDACRRWLARCSHRDYLGSRAPPPFARHSRRPARLARQAEQPTISWRSLKTLRTAIGFRCRRRRRHRPPARRRLR